MVQAERQQILERTNQVWLEVKANNIKFGRKRTVDRDKIIALYKAGIGATQIAKQTGIGRSTVYKLMRNSHNLRDNHV